MLVSGVVPPTAPPKETTPAVPATKVSAVAPSSVPEKLIFAPPGDPPPAVLSKVGAPVIATAPAIPIVPPFVVTLTPTLIVDAVTDKLLSGVIPPTAPENVVVPVPPAMVNAPGPSTVLLKLTLALFEVIVLVPV